MKEFDHILLYLYNLGLPINNPTFHFCRWLVCFDFHFLSHLLSHLLLPFLLFSFPFVNIYFLSYYLSICLKSESKVCSIVHFISSSSHFSFTSPSLPLSLSPSLPLSLQTSPSLMSPHGCSPLTAHFMRTHKPSKPMTLFLKVWQWSF